jgi:hypothetical protein
MEIEDTQIAELVQAKVKIGKELDKIASQAQITPA